MYTNFNSELLRILKFPGEFGLKESREFIQEIKKLVDGNEKPILIDCVDVDIIQSQGLGAIVQGYKICRDKNIYYGILHPSQKLLFLLETTGMDKILNLVPSTDEANTNDWVKAAGLLEDVNIEFQMDENYLDDRLEISCRGIMKKGSSFNQFVYAIEGLPEIYLDFQNLAYIDIDCLNRLDKTFSGKQIFISGCNSIIEEEFKVFQLYDKIKEVSATKLSKFAT